MRNDGVRTKERFACSTTRVIITFHRSKAKSISTISLPCKGKSNLTINHPRPQIRFDSIRNYLFISNRMFKIKSKIGTLLREISVQIITQIIRYADTCLM